MTVLNPSPVLTMTYAQRIAYDTSTLLFDSFVYQSDTVDLGSGSFSYAGYYRWLLGAWSYMGTDNILSTYIRGRLFVLNTGAVEISDDSQGGTAIQLAAGYGATYSPSYLMFCHDIYLKRFRWFIKLNGDSGGDLVFLRYDDNGNLVDYPLILYRDTGAIVANGPLYAAKSFLLTGTITPSQIIADQNDYNPTSLSNSNVLRLSSDAARNITGLAGGIDGRIIIIRNIGSFAITLKTASILSSISNRFQLKADIAISPNGSATLQYDGTLGFWMCVGSY